MSTYVISDVHGQYNSYLKMLEKIKFTKKDFLYVLGDCIDRGPDGINVIKDLMKRENAELILGNHEVMLLNSLRYIREIEAGLEPSYMLDDGMSPFELWTHPCNGGEGTSLEFSGLLKKEQEDIEAFLRSRRLIKRIKVGEKSYHLSHSYSMNKAFGKEVFYKKVSNAEAESIVWDTLFEKTKDRTKAEKLFGYQRDIYVVGHIFTQRLDCMTEDGKGEIFESDSYRGYHVIDVDCGMALNSRSSRLGCICLETGKKYYVPLLED